jgi:TonB family protein
MFEQQEKRLGGAMGASVISHGALVLIILLIMRLAPEAEHHAMLLERSPNAIVWLAEPGAGGGGGGGGNQQKEPPKKAELPGKEKITVPVEKPPEIKPQETEKPPVEDKVNIPAVTMSAANETSPGLIESKEDASSTSQGTGTGGGAGTGSGTGIGSGQGSGLGEGSGGGTGGGVYRPGNGVDSPRLLRSVRPNYTAEAMRAKVQGVVRLEGVVMPDGSVGDVKVTRSLDQAFGLDQEAIKAAKQFKFVPGTRFGEPVAVLVSFEIEFTLR